MAVITKTSGCGRCSSAAAALIVVSDASQDEHSVFADLLRVLRRARFEKGITITGLGRPDNFRGQEDEDEIVSLLSLLLPGRSLAERRPADGRSPAEGDTRPPVWSKRHFFFARINYPDEKGSGVKEGCLIYLKPTFTGDESARVARLRRSQSGLSPQPDRGAAVRRRPV